MDPNEVIATLNDLIETCKDGEYGFRACAEHTDTIELETLFGRCADDCGLAARELQDYVVQLGGEADMRGSATGALHRGWVAVRSTLAGYDDLAMLKECERAEDVAVARYRAALDKPLPERVRALVARQWLGVQKNHDQIRDLRDKVPASVG